MPRQGRKTTKSTSTLPLRTPAKDSSCQPLSATFSVDYNTLKRAQLQLQCKKLGLRATGKNTELVERLKAHHGESSLKMACNKEETNKSEESSHNFGTPVMAPPLDLAKDIKTETSEEKTDMVRGWCVVHGMVLYRPASSWVPLLLRGGLVCVQDGENLVPFHLPPLNISVPEGLLDNYVCKDCVLRTVEIKKLYQPQEDQAYAQRVDGILSQMARGELGMDRALRPLQPLVVHSPAPYGR